MPERHELPAVVLASLVVGLVRDDAARGAVIRAQPVGQRLVVVGEPDRRVDDEQHDIGGLAPRLRPGG